jgi:transcriptional regulator with XRE-family HTH domain
MVKIKKLHLTMNTYYDINEVIKNDRIDNEPDYERALIAERKLRLLAKEDTQFAEKRKKIRNLIALYEESHWSGTETLDDNKLRESDRAEQIAETEREFLETRKMTIKDKLQKIGLSQQELGIILGHKSKTHMSALMNGVNPFSLKDLIILHQLLQIDLKDLVPSFLSGNDLFRVKTAIRKLNKPQLKLPDEDLVLA